MFLYIYDYMSSGIIEVPGYLYIIYARPQNSDHAFSFMFFSSYGYR
jgi:hypothetical protein